MTDLKACQQLLLRLQRRKLVAAHELKRALGEERWEDYEGRREWVIALREKAKIASYELRNYVNMLRVADLRDAQAERMRAHRGKSMPQGKGPSDLYERALDYLSERIEENLSLADHLDRAFSPYGWDSSTNIGPDKESVPRLWFHTANALPQCEEREIKTNRQLKMEALERAIEALSGPPAVTIKRKL